MAGEEWARRIAQRELGRTVVVHDDGSVDGMYDLRVGPVDTPEMAIECVGAVDPVFAETWNVGPARGPLALRMGGDWNVQIAPTACVKAVKQSLERLLKRLEQQGISDTWADHRLSWREPELLDDLESLGITHALRYRTEGTGKVYLAMPGDGGAVDDKGSAVPGWISEFLRDPTRADVLCKLERSGAKERHAFVIVEFAGAPWSVQSYLTGELSHLPSQAPDLPPPVTGVWVLSGSGRRGLRWDGWRWQPFATRGAGIEE